MLIVQKLWNSVNVRMEEYTAAAAPPKEFMNLWIYLHNQKTSLLKSSKNDQFYIQTGCCKFIKNAK